MAVASNLPVVIIAVDVSLGRQLRGKQDVGSKASAEVKAKQRAELLFQNARWKKLDEDRVALAKQREDACLAKIAEVKRKAKELEEKAIKAVAYTKEKKDKGQDRGGLEETPDSLLIKRLKSGSEARRVQKTN